MRPLRRDDYLAVSSTNMHDIYSNTQLRTIYIDINIVDMDKGKAKYFSLLFIEHQYNAYYIIDRNLKFSTHTANILI